MGCWNKTCALSNLHIDAGDPVYVFVMQENSIEENHCYSTHLYSPIPVPFYSEYDDYGAGENSSGIGLSVILDALRKHLIEMEVGENEYHDIAVKKDSFDEALLFESVRENRLYVKNIYAGMKGQPKAVPVKFVMMRKDVVDRILGGYQFENYKFIDGKCTKAFCGFSDVLEDVDHIISHTHELFKESQNKNSPSYYRLKLDYFTIVEQSLRERDSKSYEFIWCFSLHQRFSYIVNVMDVFSTFIENGQVDSAKSFLIDALKGAYIARFMEHTRKSWIPQSGEGSQNTDLDGHKFLAQTILEVIEKEEKEGGEWDNEYEDDEDKVIEETSEDTGRVV